MLSNGSTSAASAASAAFVDEVTVLDVNAMKSVTLPWRRLAGLSDLINELGRRSALAQGLKKPITSHVNVTTGDQRPSSRRVCC